MKIVILVATVCLSIAMVPTGRAASVADSTKTDALENAKKAEEKGDLARIRKDYAQSASYYFSALHANRKDAGLCNKIGIVELQMHERSMARKYFGLAAKYDPQFIAPLNNLGAVALLDKKYKAASDRFKEALAMDEGNAHTHLNLAEAWLGMGQVDRAMTEYARALELDADVLTNSADGIQAQVATPEQQARVYYMIAKAYMKRGNPDGALDYLTRARDMHYPDLAKVYTDSDFTAIWKDPRLAKIIKR
jgi:tetratricopeptide (TPR) repeat protein